MQTLASPSCSMTDSSSVWISEIRTRAFSTSTVNVASSFFCSSTAWVLDLPTIPTISNTSFQFCSIQFLCSPCQIPWLFHISPIEALTFIKPPEVYRQAYVYSWVNTVVLFADQFAIARNRKPQSPTFRGWLFLIFLTFPWPMWNSPTFHVFQLGASATLPNGQHFQAHSKTAKVKKANFQKLLQPIPRCLYSCLALDVTGF